MSDLNLSEECKSCNMFCNQIYTCQVYKIEALKDRCPCLTCLVKISCQEQCSDRALLFVLNASRISDYENARVEKARKRWRKNGFMQRM